MPAIYSPEMAMAGFGMLGDIAPVINYVARLDGATQYWQLSEPIIINENEDFKIVINANMNYGVGGSWLSVFSGISFGFNFRLYASKSGGQPADYRFRGALSENTGVNWVEGVEDYITIQRIDGTISINATNGSYQFFEPREFSIDLMGSVATGGDFLGGYLKGFSVEKSNTLTHEIPLTNKAQGKFQVASTTPLGNNLYTQEVIENPFLASSQWSYLGEGRWFLDGQGDNSPIVFIQKSEQPQSGYVEFEIESITGGFLTCTSEFIAESRFDTAGVKTFYYENIDDIFEIQFKRSVGSVKTVIKNIKHYDADGVLIATLINYTEAVWEEV